MSSFEDQSEVRDHGQDGTGFANPGALQTYAPFPPLKGYGTRLEYSCPRSGAQLLQTSHPGPCGRF